jgi:hypothetical protein
MEHDGSAMHASSPLLLVAGRYYCVLKLVFACRAYILYTCITSVLVSNDIYLFCFSPSLLMYSMWSNEMMRALQLVR